MGALQYEESSLGIRTIVAGETNRSADQNGVEPPADISIRQLSTALLPVTKSGVASLQPRLLDVDKSTMGLLMIDGETARLLAPQPRTLAIVDGDLRASPTVASAQVAETPCLFWSASHSGSLLATYNYRRIDLYQIGDDRSLKATLSAKVEPPAGLNGAKHQIAFLSLSNDGKTLWALWEGADTFYFTERDTSRDLMAVSYRVSQQPRKSLASLFSGELPMLPEVRSFRLSLHPSGAIRIGRAFFISSDDSTLYFATEKAVAGYDATTGELRFQLPEAHSFAVSPDRRYVATASYRRSQPIAVWNTTDGTKCFESDEKFKLVRMAFGSDSRSLCVGTQEQQFIQFDVESGEIEHSMQTAVAPAAMLPGGGRYVGFLPINGPTGEFVLADTANGRRVASLSDEAHVLTQCSIDSGARCISLLNKYKVRLLHRMTADEAALSLLSHDIALEKQWFERLIKHYSNRPPRTAVDAN